MKAMGMTRHLEPLEEQVWALWSEGCRTFAEIDEELKLADGTAHDMIVYLWQEDKEDNRRSRATV